MTILEYAPGAPRCEACEHFTPVAGGPSPIGVCRRRAPTTATGDLVVNGWPKVSAADRCGEFDRALIAAASGRPDVNARTRG